MLAHPGPHNQVGKEDLSMKIGIIVYSHTGNTLFVAGKFKEELLAAGHSVDVEQVTAVNEEEKDVEKVQLKMIPCIGSYEALVFGSPVRGASISPVMAAYLSRASSLQGKKIVCFVTELFPYPWMGGNRTIEQMKKVCESKGAELVGTGIVNWSRRDRSKRINDLAKELSKLL
jgi:flavorubredoxin